MLSTKEIITILMIAILLGFSVSLLASTEIFLYTLLSIFLILIINITAKKVASFYLDSEIEIKLWELERYGLWGAYAGGFFHPSRKFKKPIPIGAFLPILTTAFTFGYIVWLASLVFEVKPKVYRAAKRYGLYTFSEMTEFHIGLIAAAGIITTLAAAGVGYLLNLPATMHFVELSVYFALYNLIPLSNLDGNKIFFGSLTLWTFLTTIALIALAAIIMIV